MVHNDQANTFSVLMESIWAGGAVYDLRLGYVNLKNACEMAALFFPKEWEAAESCPDASWTMKLPDGSSMCVTEDSVNPVSTDSLPGEIQIDDLRPYEIELLIQAKLAGGDTEDDPVIKSLRLQYVSLMGDDPSSYEIKRVG